LEDEAWSSRRASAFMVVTKNARARSGGGAAVGIRWERAGSRPSQRRAGTAGMGRSRRARPSCKREAVRHQRGQYGLGAEFGMAGAFRPQVVRAPKRSAGNVCFCLSAGLPEDATPPVTAADAVENCPPPWACVARSTVSAEHSYSRPVRAVGGTSGRAGGVRRSIPCKEEPFWRHPGNREGARRA